MSSGLATVIFLFNFFYSIFRGPKSEQNPWRANTLEWTAPVEHIHGNWPGAIPVVHRWAYDYSKPNADGSDYVIPGQDFTPQTVPMQDGEEAGH